MGGDETWSGISAKWKVSIHASAWEATTTPGVVAHVLVSFNPRLRVGGDFDDFVFHGIIEFQSTPPRGRRRATLVERLSGSVVSIHASAWEATALWLTHAAAQHQFQSTPPRGRRRFRIFNTRDKLCFNPRLRVGGERKMPDSIPLLCSVSIHASAWEATPRSVFVFSL